MVRRSRAVTFTGNTVSDAPPAEQGSGSATAYEGELESFFTDRPSFRTAVRGYDRLQVDNYLSWMEAELLAARRETDDLMARYGRSSAELELSRRLLAQSPEAQELTRTSERIGTMLRLAADEAAAMTGAAAAEADRILGEARLEADARLRKAHEIKQMALEASDQLRAEAERVQAAAAAEADRARTEAGEMLRRLQQQRQEAEAASVQAASRRVAALHAEIDALNRQRAAAVDALRQVLIRTDDALRALGEESPAPATPPVELVAVPDRPERAAS